MACAIGAMVCAIIRTDSGSVAAAALLRIVFEFGLTLRGDGITTNSCSHGFDQAISFLPHRVG